MQEKTLQIRGKLKVSNRRPQKKNQLKHVKTSQHKRRQQKTNQQTTSQLKNKQPKKNQQKVSEAIDSTDC